jgi:hypothetical protein
LGTQRGHAFRVLLLRVVQRRLRLVDGFSPTCVFLLPGRLLPGFLALATLALPFVRLSRLSVRRLIQLGGRLLRLDCRLAGWALPSILVEVLRQFGVFAKGPSDPTGRLRTTSGFAMVAAMTSGSWLSFAAP